MASTYLTRTFGTATNRKKFTLSMWVKQSGRGSGNNNSLLVSGASGQNEGTIKISSDAILWSEYNVGSSSSVATLTSNQLLRDYSAWYNLVFAWDSANATADDRMKIYLNGEQVTSFSTRTNAPLNYDAQINNSIEHNIGRQTWNSSGLFDGSMSHIHFCDGQSYDATAFGEYDDNGVWTIKTSPSVTYGTNGFFILKNGNSVTDQSGNSNNFTVASGTLTNTEDNPSNVFATWNALDKPGTAPMPGLSLGNTYWNKTGTGPGNNSQASSTLAVSSGKWYYEIKINDSNSVIIGIDQASGTYNVDGNSLQFNGISYENTGNKVYNGSGQGTYGASYTTNDIIGIAFDLDNNYIYFSKNGTWQNSSVPTSGATGTGGIAITSTNVFYKMAICNYNYNATSNHYANFGNGYFGTTAVASAGTNASGIGIFEYDVPTGFTALSTKGLNL